MTIEQVTDEQRDRLLETACEIRERAYAPYSRYAVGAAILSEDGQVFSGVNVENAVLGLGICAERSAIFTAASAGVRRIVAVAVCTENIGSPCGACRQVLSEFAGDIPIWLTDDQGNVRQTSLDTLLPDRFGPDHLPDSI
jgi:cytidine deaminase